MRQLRYLPLSVSIALSMVSLAGCGIGKIDMSDPGPNSWTPPIRYNSDRSIETPMATGSTSTISVDLPEGTHIASASTGDSTIASIGAIATYGTGSSARFPISAKTAGSTPFVVLDDEGKELARATVIVADTKAIQLETPDGLTLVDGATYTVHATTLGESNVVLVGNGAIAFEPTGALAASGSGGVLCFGDCETFHTSSAGDGHLNVVAKGASTDRTFHVVDPASVDKLTLDATEVNATLNQEAPITFTMFAGPTPVVPGTGLVWCTTADPSVATIDFVGGHGYLGEAPDGLVLVYARAPGATTVTCAVGSHIATAHVTVP